MIHGNVKEALNLVGMQVHRDQTVDAGSNQQVGDQFGGDGNARFVLAVLTCPAKVGDDCDYRGGRGALGSIDHQQELHQILTGVKRRLNQINLSPTHGFLVTHFKLAIRKMQDVDFAQFHTKFFCNLQGYVTRIRARE